MFKKGITWDRVILAMILALAGFLSFYAVWNEGYGNQYYAAAVKSMLTSFHNFFFASFDGGGFVSVDKPPLGLWIQTISAMLFGFHGWSLILPQALAAVISTALVCHLVRRSFGSPAGLIAALVFALTPILAAVSRTNNFDTMVVLVVLLAAWAVMVAAERGSLKLLLLSVGLVGLGFNIKMLQAWMVLPAIYLLYLLSPAGRVSKKLSHLLVATVLLLIVSLSWAAIVDLTPADQRPYVGSSQTNSVIELAIGYNGIQRVVPGGSPMGAGAAFGHSNISPPMQPGALAPGAQPDAVAGGTGPGEIPTAPTGGMPGGMGGPGGEGGAAGIFRLFDQQLAGQISWLLPLAILGFFASWFTLRKIKTGDARSRLRQVWFWGMWMLPMLAYFSIAGFFHRYYLVMLAPSIAALCGIGLTAMWKAYRGKGMSSLWLPLSLVITALVQAYIAYSYPEWRTWLIPVICAVSITSAFILIFAKFDGSDVFKGIARPLVVCMCAVLLIAPALWALTPIIYHSETMIPYAGPELDTSVIRASINLSLPGTGSGMPSMGSFMGGMDSSALTDFLLDHRKNETYLVAVPNANMAAGIILETGMPVMAVGGFLGSDPILTVDRLEKLVADGELRYYMTTGGPEDIAGNSTGNKSSFGGMPGMMGGGQSEITSWVKAHGTPVPSGEWGSEDAGSSAGTIGRGMGFGSSELYDLRGGS
jgi:4-amino-4-deoxy-L-arabinose transferase-like glycosyltransferase